MSQTNSLVTLARKCSARLRNSSMRRTADQQSATTTAPASDGIDIGSSDLYREGTGVKVDVEGRAIGVFRHKGELYALDHHCYHAGGPLTIGDIEDIKLKGNTHPCVVCPWHKYKISLKTGEGIYKHVDPFAQKPKAVVKSRGKKQRKHEVCETSDGRVLLTVNTTEETQYGSDYYASEEFQLRMRKR